MIRVFYKFLLLLFAGNVVAQGNAAFCWQARLDDEALVSSLSIPGAHDAATGEGLRFVPGFGKTQALSIAELWDCGVRAFDLRPAADGGLLHIYHGPLRTGISFDDALNIICSRLKENPSEFAIVLMRNEGSSATAEERALWARLAGASVAALGDYALAFSPALTVGEARGRVLFLSRDEYMGCDKGALVIGWNHSASGSTDACMKSYRDGSVAALWMQDYYNAVGEARRKEKESVVLRFLALSASAPADVWTINFLSAYSTTWLRMTPFATSSGYKRNASHLHPVVIDTLMHSLPDKKCATGILFMDYAGADLVGGGLWHWLPFKTYGAALVRRIIEQNF